MPENGSTADFTHTLKPFTIEGHTFQRQKVRARDWAETLARVGTEERSEMEKEDGSVLFAISTEGLYELISLAIRPEDLPAWEKLWGDGKLEFGELADLKDWLWEQITDRPFTSDTPSSDGPGSSSAPSSKDESPSPVEVVTN